MFVRDPIERVVSAYLDKFVVDGESSLSIRKHEGKKFQRMYREDKDDVERDGNGTTFEEFTRYVVDSSHSPTDDFNDHWETMTRLCQPCLAR